MDYYNILSKKVLEIKPSGIRKFFDIVSNMDNVISLGVGEPDFDTPFEVKQSAINALNQNLTSYSSNSGILPLRLEISKYLNSKFNLSYDYNDEILITAGSSEAIDACIRAIIDPDDQVIIPQPAYVSYQPIVHLSGGVPIPIHTLPQNNFIITPDQLKAKITNKTKLLILNYPNNPTGAIMQKHQLQAIADVIKNTNIMVLSDEIYAELTYGVQHCSFPSLQSMKERTILVSGFSKAFSMTGWRLGYACAPKPIITQMTKIHQYSIMCAPTISQFAAINALKSTNNNIINMKNQYDIRRKFIVNAFNEMGLHCFEPLGAFYVFPNISSTGLSSEDFAQKLLLEQNVAVVPGNAFGETGEGFIRVSYSYSMEHISEAINRIKLFIQNLKG